MLKVHVGATEVDSSTPYDLVFCAIGFESRARYAAETLQISGTKKMALAFDDRQNFAFDANWHWFKDAGFTCVSVDDELFREYVNEAITRAFSKGTDVRVWLDISSFNRVRLAILVNMLVSAVEGEKSCSVSFVYSLAGFSTPSSSTSTNNHVGPVIPEFAGWAEDPMLPPHVLLGLGYEQGKALGALDHLEISDALAFVPQSPVSEYYEEVLKANEDLLSNIGMEHVVRYNVHDPVRTFSMVESAVNGLRKTCNPVLLPFGPKIFFITSLLVALLHPECAVWRVSAGSAELPVDRTASGHIIQFCVVLSTRFDDY